MLWSKTVWAGDGRPGLQLSAGTAVDWSQPLSGFGGQDHPVYATYWKMASAPWTIHSRLRRRIRSFMDRAGSILAEVGR